MYGVNPLRLFSPAPKSVLVNVTFIIELLKVFSRKEKLKYFTRYSPQKPIYTNVCASGLAVCKLRIQNYKVLEIYALFKSNFVMDVVKMNVKICAGRVTHLTIQ